MSEEKKLKGFAAMTPEARAAAMAKGHARRAENKAARLAGLPAKSKPIKVKDNLDVKLDHFQYTLNPEEQAIWENDTQVSPLTVPREIKKDVNYAGLEWRWVSNRTLEVRGKNYNGWELFRDKNHPEGVKRGNDLQLAAMPRSLAESYRRSVSERSTEMVRNMQSITIGKMEQAVRDLNDPGSGLINAGEMVGGRRVDGGIQVGRRAQFGRGGNYQRGMPREEVHERIAKSIEERRKNKVFVDMGR